ncbi:Ser-Thr-rich glycosyl-phosphatidyl-inositol-anchored membrane family [Kalmanozyma brasiliensis GHG001]|uniref:Yeast cell wall synthesis Kre9/Knh1-like N-terminal domain-containing protein n=1 Tax=Kalmanozyma brasiliensis (strain GHG001) TaxID=1365824 RepID=V5ERL8_KALBG|nr:Ser-Thr-rich glycosyl-phosphatidyl-inositol-anchored membrane family [Kalmanozyma brasiliensis GHG001]EST07795.1 Ser-Thr-rich glycosyl-phosphatidyl-inositol-anchored membrane family [Kalmanozyma brasiliensis GHG001]
MVSAKITTLAVLLLAAADAAVSTIVVTRPVASTSGRGGSNLRVEWNDDGKAPTRRDWGRVNIYLAVGTRDVQYKLQTLASNISYNTDEASYPINASVGPSGGYYFLRFEGTNTTTNVVPAMAFSARFTLTGMTGTFNSTVAQAASGSAGTAPLTAAASASTSSGSPSFFGYTSSSSASSAAASALAGLSSSGSAAAAQSTGKSTSAAAQVNGKLAGYASALVGIAAVGAAFL